MIQEAIVNVNTELEHKWGEKGQGKGEWDAIGTSYILSSHILSMIKVQW